MQLTSEEIIFNESETESVSSHQTERDTPINTQSNIQSNDSIEQEAYEEPPRSRFEMARHDDTVDIGFLSEDEQAQQFVLHHVPTAINGSPLAPIERQQLATFARMDRWGILIQRRQRNDPQDDMIEVMEGLREVHSGNLTRIYRNHLNAQQNRLTAPIQINSMFRIVMQEIQKRYPLPHFDQLRKRTGIRYLQITKTFEKVSIAINQFCHLRTILRDPAFQNEGRNTIVQDNLSRLTYIALREITNKLRERDDIIHQILPGDLRKIYGRWIRLVRRQWANQYPEDSRRDLGDDSENISFVKRLCDKSYLNAVEKVYHTSRDPARNARKWTSGLTLLMALRESQRTPREQRKWLRILKRFIVNSRNDSWSDKWQTIKRLKQDGVNVLGTEAFVTLQFLCETPFVLSPSQLKSRFDLWERLFLSTRKTTDHEIVHVHPVKSLPIMERKMIKSIARNLIK